MGDVSDAVLIAKMELNIIYNVGTPRQIFYFSGGNIEKRLKCCLGGNGRSDWSNSHIYLIVIFIFLLQK